MPTLRPASPRSRRPRARLAAALLALTLLPFTAVASSAPATAATSQFRGMNWGVAGDNFSTSPLVLDGLSSSDSYDTVRAKANALYDDMASTLGVNTVRLPVNTHTVGTAWWGAYRGTIDAATARGWKVILGYWEDGAASGGRVTNTAAWNSMWNTILSQYASNSLVYFEPMNEPHGYTSTAWRDTAAAWLSSHSNAPDGRVLIGGTGYSQDLRDVCNDSRFNSTLLSFHTYTFMYGAMTYDAWRSHITTRLGNCASRAIVTEFGSAMNSGLNYNDSGSTHNMVRYLRAVAQVMRDNSMGGVYWPAAGGKLGSIGYDWYSMYVKSGSGTALDLTIRNYSGGNQYRYAMGDNVNPSGGTGSGSRVGTIAAKHSGKCMDVVAASMSNAAEVSQYTCGTGTNQRIALNDLGNGYYHLVAQHSGKCIEVNGASTADGANITQYTCSAGTNQQWERISVGSDHQFKNRNSGKCIDVPSASTANGTRLKQYTCNTSSTNQVWTIRTS
jgi:hypothetical protein